MADQTSFATALNLIQRRDPSPEAAQPVANADAAISPLLALPPQKVTTSEKREIDRNEKFNRENLQ